MKNIVVVVLITVALSSPCLAQNNDYSNGVEPTAGNWEPWIIESVVSIPVPPPPSKVALKQELKEIIALQNNIDSVKLKQIQYWNAGPAAYQWQKIADALYDPNQYWPRIYAYMSVAIYDATLVAWKAKYQHNRIRPFEAKKDIKSLVLAARSPSFPCEHAVAAGAAATVLGYLFPEKADSLLQLAKDVGMSRVVAGVQYPSDVEVGFDIGVKVAEQVIAKAKMDGFDKVWTGTVPVGRNYYTGKPLKKDLMNLKTWVLTSPDQFRSPPPPDLKEDMEAVKNYKADHLAKSRGFRWEFSWPWGEVVDQKIFEYNLSGNAPKAALVYALVSISDYDNQVAHWDSKYTHFRARPDQYDTTFVPLFPTPTSPSYPAGHATMAYCRAIVLSYLFPYDRNTFFRMAKEATHSRFEAGVHYPSDNTAGEALGLSIGEEIVRWAKAKTPVISMR